MVDLELKRTPGDRRLYALAGVGTLRLEGFASRTATAEAGGDSWRIARRRFWQRVVQATDAAGSAVGEFKPDGLRRGGTLRWADRELTLRPASRWRERYALADGDRELAVLDGKGWGRSRSPSTTPGRSSRGCCSSRPSSSAGSRRTPGPPQEQPRRASDDPGI